MTKREKMERRRMIMEISEMCRQDGAHVYESCEDFSIIAISSEDDYNASSHAENIWFQTNLNFIENFTTNITISFSVKRLTKSFHPTRIISSWLLMCMVSVCRVSEINMLVQTSEQWEIINHLQIFMNICFWYFTFICAARYSHHNK